MSALRPIDLKNFAPCPTPGGAAPQLAWIEIARLVIDDDYQRALDANRRSAIRKIAANFDWDYFSPVMVSPVPGGLYAIIDGQGRATAAAICGLESVPCQITLADKAKQARAFAAVNGAIVAVRPMQRFKALTVAGDPQALRIGAVARAARVTIRPSQGGDQASKASGGDMFTVAPIQRAIDKYGEALTTKALECARTALEAHWSKTPGYLRGVTLAAVARVLHDEPAWLARPDLLQTFGAIPLEQIRRAAELEAAGRRDLRPLDIICGELIDALSTVYDEVPA